MTRIFDASFIFVCQQGELEIKSMILAASLRKHMGFDVELIAAVPHPVSAWGTISDTTSSIMDGLCVRRTAIENPLNEDYPIGNKLACLAVATPAKNRVFLDSDILCLRPIPEASFPGSFNAKPADLRTWPLEPDDWESAYAAIGVTLPKRRVRATVSGELMPPYFNAGVIAVRQPNDFARQWTECCRRVEDAHSIQNKRPHLDQIGLSLALAKTGLEFHCLGEELNFPAHLKTLDKQLPVLCHYHDPRVLREEPLLNTEILDLMERWPQLEDLLTSSGDAWTRLTASYKLKIPSRRSVFSLPLRRTRPKAPSVPFPVIPRHRDVIITGIPRSGTSLLCRLLHDQDDCIIVNEPREIFDPLRDCENPWWISSYYRLLRRRILDRETVLNKVIDGRVIEDTAEIDELHPYAPSVSHPDFLLGTKNTLVYLARIAVLKRAMPGALIIACVRHPMDTVASWKATFPHLEGADLEAFPANYMDNPILTLGGQKDLREIMRTPDRAARRALLWSYLACLILDQRDRLHLIRYEDLIDDPNCQLQAIFDAFPDNRRTCNRSAERLALRSRRSILDDDDVRTITDLCRDAAERLGYRF